MIPINLLGASLSATILVARTPEARDCPDADQIAARVERIVGRPISAPEGTPNALVVRLEFSRRGRTYEATVRLSGAREGERVLRDEEPTCDALVDAVAAATAVLLDPSDHPRSTPPDTLPRPNAARSWPAFWMSGRFGAATGLVGGPTWIASGTLEGSLGALTSIELGASMTGARANDLGAGAVEVRLWYIELGGFHSVTGPSFRLGPCLQLLGGALQGRGEGYPSSSSASLPWFALGGGLRAEAVVGSDLRLGVRAVGLVPTRKHSFSIGYVGTAHESSPVAGVAELILAVKFW
jgi:hypothetical protein